MLSPPPSLTVPALSFSRAAGDKAGAMAWDSTLVEGDRTALQFALAHLSMAHDLRKAGEAGAEQNEIKARQLLCEVLDAPLDTMRGEA